MSLLPVIVRLMRLLITNDDGINAPGIQALTRAISQWVALRPEERSAIVVAPNRNFSGMSSAVGDIFDNPMVAYERRVIEGAENIPAYALDAAPALCTIIGGIGYLGERPTMVVSGINAGANVGRSVLHSGTIGAILTGAQLGMSGLAVSSQWDEAITHYETAAKIAVEVLDQFYDAPERTLLNLNVPNLSTADLKGVRRGRISNAGIIKATRSEEAGFTLGESGEIPLRFGAATPQLGDVSDEQADEDGALVVAGYASLTALRGVHEDTDISTDDLMRLSLTAIEAHLASHR
ncbi:MAG: hypothetical protein F2729_01370 [Actinobacteria bacterium]|uniref:Unannotated protein n=1 Tax=freshwater metagenome TaxID=449393 RepID=A0A6J6W1A1_9ZZZZ|nr:hypothetical protein [Actinomycetota bacterium]